MIHLITLKIQAEVFIRLQSPKRKSTAKVQSQLKKDVNQEEIKIGVKMANDALLALVNLTKKSSENKTEQKIKIVPVICPCCGAAIKKSHSVCEYCGLFLNIESNTDF